MSLPDAESRLQAHLGNRFVDSDWRTALATVMEAEEDTKKALETIDDLHKAAISRLGLKFRIPARPTNPVATKSQQPLSVEEDLMGKVKLLKSRNRIFGDVPTVEECYSSFTPSWYLSLFFLAPDSFALWYVLL